MIVIRLGIAFLPGAGVFLEISFDYQTIILNFLIGLILELKVFDSS